MILNGWVQSISFIVLVAWLILLNCSMIVSFFPNWKKIILDTSTQLIFLAVILSLCVCCWQATGSLLCQLMDIYKHSAADWSTAVHSHHFKTVLWYESAFVGLGTHVSNIWKIREESNAQLHARGWVNSLQLCAFKWTLIREGLLGNWFVRLSMYARNWTAIRHARYLIGQLAQNQELMESVRKLNVEKSTAFLI